MAEDKIYLTVANEKRQPQDDGYIAVISQGSPQKGDGVTVILDVELVANLDEAEQWFERMLVERPWETRN